MKYLLFLPNGSGLEWSGGIKGGQQKEDTSIYSLKILWRVLFKRSLFIFRSKTKQSNQNTAGPTMESSLVSVWNEETAISRHLLLHSNLIFAWLLRTLPPQASASCSPALSMTDRGVPYHGAYVCTAHSFPVLKTRGCGPETLTGAPACLG